LLTFYKSGYLDSAGLVARMDAISSEVSMFVIDHLHYIDTADENELRAVRDMVSRIRDMALGLGKPVVLVAHLRKQDAASLVPNENDFHGSSNVVKIATHAVMLARAPHDPSLQAANIRRTFVHVPKDRRDGATGMVALMEYDTDAGMYRRGYQLGRVAKGKWESINHQAPSWARHHVRLTEAVL
jgi:hypothetical protein